MSAGDDVDALTLALDDLRAQVSEAVERRDTAQQAAYRAAREADDLGAEWRRTKRALDALMRDGARVADPGGGDDVSDDERRPHLLADTPRQCP